MPENDALARFAVQVSTLRDKQQERVDQELLDSVARDLGMSDADLALVAVEAKAHKERGAALRRQSLIDEAIRELDAAMSLAPLDVEAQYLLADALFARARKSGSADDHAHAQLLVESVLSQAPSHGDAAALLAALKNNPPRRGGGARITAFAFAAFLAAMGAAWWLFH
jgi:tetratricopeptide (TPR) repeat protein